jgi:hypothetical protein
VRRRVECDEELLDEINEQVYENIVAHRRRSDAVAAFWRGPLDTPSVDHVVITVSFRIRLIPVEVAISALLIWSRGEWVEASNGPSGRAIGPGP